MGAGFNQKHHQLSCLMLRPKYRDQNIETNIETKFETNIETKKRPSGAFCLRQNAQRAALRAAGQATSGNSYPTCRPLVRFFHIAKGASKMLRATGHARMVTPSAAFLDPHLFISDCP